MTYTPIPAGTTQWDVPVNAAFTDQDARITDNTNANQATSVRVDANSAELAEINDFRAEDYGLIAWTYDPCDASNQLAIPVGVVNMVRIKIRKTTTVTNLGVGVSTAGTMNAGNFLGLYNSAGTRLGQTADQSTAWASTGYKTAALTAPVQVTPGDYYVAILSNFSVSPQFVRGSNLGAPPEGQLVNLDLPNSTLRFATFGTGLTALPASINMSSRAGTRTAWWVTLS